MQGFVLEVSISRLGDELDIDHALGATVLTLTDADDFIDDDGPVSEVEVDGATYVVSTVDEFARTVTITTGLASAFEAGTQVYVRPATREKWALVETNEHDEPISALVGGDLYDRITDGVRDPEAQEAVSLELQNGDWTIINIIGEKPTIDGDFIDPATMPPAPSSDGLAPSTSPQPTLTPGIGTLFIKWTAISNADPVMYDVYLSAANPVPVNSTTFIGSTAGTMFLAGSLTDGSALSSTTDYRAVLVARDEDGSAPAGLQSLPARPVLVTAVDLAEGSVTTPKIANLAVDVAKLADGSVSAVKIIDGAVGTTKLVDGSVLNAKLADDAVSLTKLAAGSVDNTKLVDAAVTAVKVATGAITETKIGTDAVTTPKIATNAVTADEIAALAITAGKIAAGVVTATELATDSVVAGKIAAGAVTTPKLAAGAVTANEIATDTITANKIASGAIGTDELAAGSVVAGKIASGAVTTEKLTVASFGDNLILNGGAQEAQETDSTRPALWFDGSSGGRIHRETGVPAPGGAWLVLDSPANPSYSRAMSHWFPVNGGETYLLSCIAAYTTGPTRFYFGIGFNTGLTDPGLTNGTEGDAGRYDIRANYSSLPVNTGGPSTWERVEGQITTPTGAKWARVIAYNWQPTSQSFIVMDDIRVRKITVSAQIKDGAIVTAKLAANAVTANEIAANAVTAGKIMANAVTAGKLESALLLSTRIVSGSLTGARLEMNPTELLATDPDGEPVISLAPGSDDFLKFTNSVGDILASIGSDGSIAGKDIEWTGTLRGDSTAIELTDRQGSLASALSSLSGGILHWGSRDPDVTGIQGEYGLLQIDFQLSEDRQILFILKTGFNSSPAGAAEMNTVHSIRYTYGADGFVGNPGNTGTLLTDQWFYPLHRGGRRATPTFVGMKDLAAGFYRMRYSMNASNNAAADSINVTEPVSLWLVDGGSPADTQNIGVKPVNLGAALATGGSDTGSAGTAAKKSYTRTYVGTWSRGYNESGSQISSGSNHKQGHYSGTNGNTKAAVGFDDAQMRRDLNGVPLLDVDSTEIYLYFNHWYINAGGTAIIGTHNQAGAVADWININGKSPDRWRSSGWPKPGGRWVTVPNSVAIDIRDNLTKGILVGPGPTTALEYYGTFNGAVQSNPPKIRIKYRK